MKKLFALTLSVLLGLSLVACSAGAAAPDSSSAAGGASTASSVPASSSVPAEADPEFVTVSTLDGNGEPVDIEVPYNPQRLAVMDLGALDILDNLGVGDRIVAVSKGSTIDYLQSYVEDDSLLNLGTIKEADMEAVMESEPDVIFIGGRLSSYYDELAAIAPVIYLGTDATLGVVESTMVNAKAVASIFGKQEQVDTLMAEYDARITDLQAFAQEKTAVVGMVTSGGLNVMGNDGRCTIIGVEIGFENVGVDANVDTATHGNEASFEFLVEVDPDYIFIMDRDAAIGTEGAQLAQQVMDNELVNMTAAAQNNQIVYLAHPNVWYTAEGGITALGIMLTDLEDGLGL